MVAVRGPHVAQPSSPAGRSLMPSTTGAPVRAALREPARRRRSSICSSSRSAPALDSGSLRLPHLGDCTQEGQPSEQRHSAISRRASSQSSSKRGERRPGDPDPAGVAVVDEDRRAPRLGVEVGGQPADVPAVAHRDQRQHRDLRVLGRVQRAQQGVHRQDVIEVRGAPASPAASSNQSAWVEKLVGGRSSANRSTWAWSASRLRW